jgi:hypothetical protein
MWFEVNDPLTGETYRDPNYSHVESNPGVYSLNVKGPVLKIRVYNNDNIDSDDLFSLIIYAQGS